MENLELFDRNGDLTKDGKTLRDRGIEKAVTNAESKHPNWKKKALEYLLSYPENRFMTEQVREWAHDHGLPKPPHARAWGAVIVAAKKLGYIEFIRYESVVNPKAHMTPASVWRRI